VVQLHSTGFKTTQNSKVKPLFSFKPEAMKDEYVLITREDIIDLYKQLPQVSFSTD